MRGLKLRWNRSCGLREKKHNIANKKYVRAKRKQNMPDSWDTCWTEIQHSWKWQSKKRYQWFKHKWLKEVVPYFTWSKEEVEKEVMKMLDAENYEAIQEMEDEIYIKIRGQKQ